MDQFDPNTHRKLVKHYENPAHVRELTFSCYQRRSLLTDDRFKKLLASAIDAAAFRHHWRLTAFVFMPEHLHLLVFPIANASRMSEFLFAIKRPTSYRIKMLLQAERNPLLEALTIRQRPKETTFRFWQEGPGYDRNLEHADAVLAAIDYLHLNPVRRGLCKHAIDWKWSSARWYHDGTVDPDWPRLEKLPADFFDRQ